MIIGTCCAYWSWVAEKIVEYLSTSYITRAGQKKKRIEQIDWMVQFYHFRTFCDFVLGFLWLPFFRSSPFICACDWMPFWMRSIHRRQIKSIWFPIYPCPICSSDKRKLICLSVALVSRFVPYSHRSKNGVKALVDVDSNEKNVLFLFNPFVPLFHNCALTFFIPLTFKRSIRS